MLLKLIVNTLDLKMNPSQRMSHRNYSELLALDR